MTQPAIHRIGIITGVAEEADAFMPGQADSVDQYGHLSVRSLIFGDKEVSICCSGVGKVNAAIAATLLVANDHVDLLMIIGTAGKLSDLPGQCFVLGEAVQSDFGAIRPDGFAHFTAGSWPIGDPVIEAWQGMRLPVDLPVARIVTGDSFVECPDHSRRLQAALSGDLVDMETGALAQTAAALGVPWAGIKAVTDDANGASVGDFQANLRRAARLAAEAAETAISAL